MEKSKQREYESIINSQKEQLMRYETRLKDVVTAYKGLLKEKAALDASLSAITGKESKAAETGPSSSSDNKQTTKGDNDMQIATLMNSLATLSAEKSRMEASFQGDKKQLRQEIAIKDKSIRDLQEKLKMSLSSSQLELENVRSKIIVERHDRDREHNDYMVQLKELQKLLADERHLKENLEMQLNDLKTQFSSTSQTDRTIKELSNELEAAKKKLKTSETMKSQSRDRESSAILHQLQSEMSTLKQNHAAALKNEQKRAFQAEERYTKLSSVHEERVANLESRLAELSTTVGNYDRLREQDKENIFKLKEKIAQLSISESQDTTTSAITFSNSENEKSVDEMIEEMRQLKRIVLHENIKLDQPRDMSKLFSSSVEEHSTCIEKINKFRQKYEQTNEENVQLSKLIENQKNHIKTLQEKVMVLNRNIDEQEHELREKMVESSQDVIKEKTKWKEIINAMETDFRGKVAQLELSLQKQRDRSLSLLEEKENEIKALKTSYEVFIPDTTIPNETDSAGQEAEKSAKTLSTAHLNSVLATNPSANTGTTASGDHHHMLHYVHELARKDVEISQLRKAKHSAETALRQALQNKVASQEELHVKINLLEEHVDRLERNKSREGENLEYLKNVFVNFLITNEIERKKHMLNAIGAVLKFNPSEMKQITRKFVRKLK